MSGRTFVRILALFVLVAVITVLFGREQNGPASAVMTAAMMILLAEDMA